MHDHPSPNQNIIPLKKAILAIFFSVLLISGSSFLAFIYYQHLKGKKSRDSTYQIVAVVQTCPHPEGLKTVFLTELLELSIDNPTNLYSFNSKEAQKKLLNCPAIKEASVRKIHPGTIHVDYTLRKPIAFLADFTNTVIDDEGIPFPFKPIFTPKKLPEIYLGMQNSGPLQLGKILQEERMVLAIELLDFLMGCCCDELSTLCSVDVSKAFSLSFGQRQIVIVFEDRLERVIEGRHVFCIYPRILRLDPHHFHQQLSNYLVLRNHLRKLETAQLSAFTENNPYMKAIVIDLRLPELAFISKEI